jgi:tetratricopeptide (TPR) repeat protein
MNSGDRGAATRIYEQGVGAVSQPFLLAAPLAALHEQQGRPEDAIKVYEALERNGKYPDPVANNLALLLVEHRTDATSLAKAEQLVERFAGSSVASYLNTYGWVKYKRGAYADAVPILEKAANQAPDKPQMRYHLGMAQLKAGQRESALRNLQAAVDSGLSFDGLDDARAALAELRRS